MKKQIILGLGLLIGVVMQAQSPSGFWTADQYLHFSVGVGDHNLSYNFQNGVHSGRVGYSLNAAYSYFFTPQWGVEGGVGIQSFGALSTLNFQSATPAKDSDGDNYEFRDAYQNWQERQQVLQFEIPLALQFRYRLNKKSRLLASLGGKVSFPLKTSYKTLGGEMVTTGYYSQWNAVLSDLPKHGFSTYTNSYSGNLTLKRAYMVTADVGELYKLSEKLDLYMGGYFNYGLNNVITTGSKQVYQSDGTYNGFFGSDQVSKVIPIALGVKVGIYWKVECKRGKKGMVSEMLPVTIDKSPVTDPANKESTQGASLSTPKGQTVQIPIRTNQNTDSQTLIVNQSKEVLKEPGVQVEVEQSVVAAKIGSEKPTEITKPADVKPDLNDNKALENGSGKIEPLVETVKKKIRLEKVPDALVSSASSVNGTENAKALVKTSGTNENFENARIIAHSIVLKFRTKSHNSLANESDKIKALSEILKANTGLHLLIVGHTCSIGSRRVNKRVGLRRARLVKQKFVEFGVSTAQLKIASKAFRKSLVSNTSKRNRAINRRVEIQVFKCDS